MKKEKQHPVEKDKFTWKAGDVRLITRERQNRGVAKKLSEHKTKGGRLAMLCMSVAVLSTAAVRADDIKLDDGKTVYHNAVITSYDAASVTIRHSTGLARIPIPELPPELRATFQYDPEKAKKLLATEQGTILTTNAVVEADTSRDVARAAWNKSKIRLSGTIVQITSEGVLMREFGKDQVIFIKHAAIGNHADGDFVSIDAAPVGTHKYVTTAGAEATVRAYDAGP